MNRLFWTMMVLWCAAVSAPAKQQAYQTAAQQGDQQAYQTADQQAEQGAEHRAGLQAGPATLVMDPAALMQARAAYAADAPGYRAVFSRLRSDAGKAMKLEPVSVMQKRQLPPSGDRHDYMSMGRYWWPDPSGDKSKPYIRKDGESNPEIRDFPDHDNFAILVRAVRVLSLEYFIAGTPASAEHAAALLRTWFLDPDTRMNPNLNFAQAIPGRNEGRGAGIIDVRGITSVLDAVILLRGSPSWSAADDQGMTQWCRLYLSWLRESENGRHEMKAKNNHGTWYDVQAVALALFVRDTVLARTIAGEATTRRIASQIEPDGRQPEELARTSSWQYSCMNADGMFTLATLAERAGVDLWNYRTADGRSIRGALDYLLPFALGTQRWEVQEIRGFVPGLLWDLIRQAVQKWGSTYAGAERTLAPEKAAREYAILLHPVASTP